MQACSYALNRVRKRMLGLMLAWLLLLALELLYPLCFSCMRHHTWSAFALCGMGASLVCIAPSACLLVASMLDTQLAWTLINHVASLAGWPPCITHQRFHRMCLLALSLRLHAPTAQKLVIDGRQHVRVELLLLTVTAAVTIGFGEHGANSVTFLSSSVESTSPGFLCPDLLFR